MVDTLTWEILHCSGYIVPSCKGMEDHDALEQIKGSTINIEKSSVVTSYFKPLFEKVYEDCKIPIRFSNTDGEQKNKIRDLVKALVFPSDFSKEDASKELALRLSLAADQRSPKGLLICASGYSPEVDEFQVVLWKFPTDESIQAVIEEGGISIELIQGAFSRNAKFFKAAVFRDVEAERNFWEGRVEDRQSNQRVHEGSKFWITEFLNAEANITSSYGTQMLANALRETINDLQDYELQDRVIAATTTAKSQTDTPITFKKFSENYLPPELREKFEKHLGTAILEIPFKINEATLDEYFGVRTLIVIAGNYRVNIVAPVKDFKNIIQLPETLPSVSDNVTEIVIKGQIVGGRINTSRYIK